MADICGNSIHFCRARITRLHADGTVAVGSTSHVVTANPVMITVAPDILAGEQKDLVGGCDCLCASYRGYDKLRRWDLTLQFCALEPAIYELITGAALLTNGGGDAIGAAWANQLLCSQPHQPPVAIEAWSDLYIGDSQNANPRYIRWVWPMAFFQPEQYVVQNDWLLPSFKGFTRTNAQYGDPYHDLPTGISTVPAEGGWFYDNGDLPTPVCGYSTFST